MWGERAVRGVGAPASGGGRGKGVLGSQFRWAQGRVEKEQLEGRGGGGDWGGGLKGAREAVRG